MIYNWINKPLLGIKLNRTHRLSKDLVGCWLFNEGGGNKVYNMSGNGNHGTLVGMAFPATATSGWNPGRKGVGLRFDGVGAYIDCGNDSSLDITDAITIEAWVKKASSFTGVGIAVAGQYADVEKKDFSLFTYTGGTMYFDVGNGTASGRAVNNAGASLNEWIQLVGTYNGSQVKVYYNGAVGGTVGSVSGNISFSGDPITIGRQSTGGFFDGSIDGVKIYNRALSASEISQMYRTPFCMFEIDDSWILQAGKPKPPTGANIVAAKLLL